MNWAVFIPCVVVIMLSMAWAHIGEMSSKDKLIKQWERYSDQLLERNTALEARLRAVDPTFEAGSAGGGESNARD